MEAIGESNENRWNSGMCVNFDRPLGLSDYPLYATPFEKPEHRREDGGSIDDRLARRPTAPERQLTDTSGIDGGSTTVLLVPDRREEESRGHVKGTRQRKCITNLAVSRPRAIHITAGALSRLHKRRPILHSDRSCRLW